MLTPSAASTSAEPHLEERLRLPCFATGTPAPATTSAVAVDMLKLPEASPPVPQVSIALGGACTISAFARMARAAPVISSTVSPRTRSAIRKPPICEGVAFPDSMASKASADSASLRRWPCAALPISTLKPVVSMLTVPASCGDRGLLGELDEVREQRVSALGRDALGVELHAVDRPLPVHHTHDDAVVGLGVDPERGGQALPLHHQRVIARRLERAAIEPVEQAGAVMADAAQLAMHRHRCPHHLAAESLADRLVAETHAEQGDVPGAAHELEADAGVIGIARARRDHDALRPHRKRLIDAQRIIPPHHHLGTELAQVMPEVVGEAVVVIDEQEHGPIPRGSAGYNRSGAARQNAGKQAAHALFRPWVNLPVCCKVSAMDTEQKQINIGSVAEATGLPAKTIRYYESIGLVGPARRTATGNYRLYDDRDVTTLRFIERARRLGFSLKEVAELLTLWQIGRAHV